MDFRTRFSNRYTQTYMEPVSVTLLVVGLAAAVSGGGVWWKWWSFRQKLRRSLKPLLELPKDHGSYYEEI